MSKGFSTGSWRVELSKLELSARQLYARCKRLPMQFNSSHIDEVLRFAIDREATDVQIGGNKPVWIRAKGSFAPIGEKLTPQDSQRMIYEILTDESIRQFETQRRADVSYALPRSNKRFRVNVYRDRGTVSAAFRVIPANPWDIDKLNLPVLPLPSGNGSIALADVLKKEAGAHRGLILLTGPTGSGKSTTAAATVDFINRTRGVHVITIENPIEYLHEDQMSRIVQRELGSDTLAFQEGLEDALREDPDVIVVGEMRNLETIQLAVTAAETGHLVISTLHTTNAAETINRIVDPFPAAQQGQVRTQVANSLRLVVCQQLVPTAKGDGRVLAVEVMKLSANFRNLIRQNKVEQIPSLIQSGLPQGNIPMDRHLAILASKGVVPVEEARARANNQEDFRQYLESYRTR